MTVFPWNRISGVMPGNVPIQTNSLGLPVAFVNGQAGGILPCLDYFRIEWFTGAHAVTEFGKIELVKVSKDQHPVDSRGTAEGGDTVFLDEGQDLGRVEPAPDIVHKDRRSFDPLPVEFSPCTFCPAGI